MQAVTLFIVGYYGLHDVKLGLTFIWKLLRKRDEFLLPSQLMLPLFVACIVGLLLLMELQPLMGLQSAAALSYWQSLNLFASFATQLSISSL
nr:hypothetical protein [Tanacetum cinerariifolium]